MRTKCFSVTFVTEVTTFTALVWMKFQAVDGTALNVLFVPYVDAMTPWEGKNLQINLKSLCVARKLTGILSTKLEVLEGKSILALCAYPVKGYGRKDNIALSATFASEEKGLEIEAKIYLTRKPQKWIMPIAGSAQDNTMPSVLEELLDLFAKDVKDVLKKNVWLWLAMLQLFHQKFLQELTTPPLDLDHHSTAPEDPVWFSSKRVFFVTNNFCVAFV